ncbi:MAG TPA: hypothetical protein VJT16_19910 [Streptosporangiaceae bacterium]|nr:hypothetical protein [Streptosporangiaceae bacterium]
MNTMSFNRASPSIDSRGIPPGHDRLRRDQGPQAELRHTDEPAKLPGTQFLSQPRGQRARGDENLSVLNLVVGELERSDPQERRHQPCARNQEPGGS